MSAFALGGETFALRVAATLLHFFWQGFFIAVGVLVLGLLLRNVPARIRYAVNVAALLLMVACLPATFVWVSVSDEAVGVSSPTGNADESRSELTQFSAETSGISLAALAAGRPVNAPAEPTSTLNGPKVAPAKTAAIARGLTETASTVSPGAPRETAGWMAPVATVVTWGYFVGVLLMTLRLAMGLRGGQDLRRASTPIVDTRLLAMVRSQAEQIGLRVAPAIAFCEQISIPIVIGVVRPMILLPATVVSGLSSDQLQALVTHELSHIRRYDLLVNLLQRIIEAVLFFHPAVWFVSRRVSSERENVADDAVLAAGWPATRYAEALVRMAELSTSLRRSGLATQVAALAAAGGSSSEFKRRVLRLLDSSATPQLRLTRGCILAIALAAASLFATPIVVQTRAQEGSRLTKGETAKIALPGEEPTEAAADRKQKGVSVEEASAEKPDGTNEPAARTEPRTIDGFVTGPEGAIAGVKATVTLSVPDKSKGLVVGLGGGRRIKELVYTTGENGRYTIVIPAELAANPELLISVRLSHPKYLERFIGAIPVSDFDATVDRQAQGVLRSMAKAAINQSRLKLAQRLTGQVLLADGSPAVGAQVKTATKYQAYSWKFHSPNDYGFSSSTKTDKDGRFSVQIDSQAALTAMQPGQAPLLVDDVEKHVRIAGDGPDVFRLPPGIRLKGRVLDDRGQPVPRALITARREFAWNESNMPLSFSINCAADELGQYELPPLPADQYKLTVNSRLASDCSPAEYNRFIGGFNTSDKPKIETEPLDLVFVPVSRKLEFTDPLPLLDLQASPMVTVNVKVEFPNGPPDPKRSSDVGITGLMNGKDWQGAYVTADENGVAILRAPKGLRLASIKTGLARHRSSPDADIEIGQAIHMGELTGDRDGFTVIKPEFAKLNVKLKLPEELSRKYSRSKAVISITAEYERKGYQENSPTPQRLWLIGSRQSGATDYSGTALPDEPILLTVSLKEDGEQKTIHEEKLTLTAGEERDHQIVIAQEENEAAEQSPAEQELKKRVDAAAAKATRDLLTRQRPDGSWSSRRASDAFPAGATAMVALAIYDSGPQSDKAAQAATEYLLKASPDTTKEVALQTMFLHRIGKPGAALLRHNLQWLIDAQIKEGPDAGSWSYRKEPVGQRGDGANTAYAILALSVAAPAGKESESSVPNEVWQRAQSWLLKSQQDDGGWGYTTATRQTTGAMTACGLAGLKATEQRLKKSPQSQAAVERAQAWLNSHWSTTTNPGGGRVWRTFYLYWMSLALRDQAKLGDRDWHAEMLDQLLRSQKKDGSFEPEFPSMTPEISTALALEILKQGSTPKSE